MQNKEALPNVVPNHHCYLTHCLCSANPNGSLVPEYIQHFPCPLPLLIFCIRNGISSISASKKTAPTFKPSPPSPPPIKCQCHSPTIHFLSSKLEVISASSEFPWHLFLSPGTTHGIYSPLCKSNICY